MKAMTTYEKFELIRSHGKALSLTGMGARAALKTEVIESAQRILELAKTIPKVEWGIEDK